jgi:hypothetical protein
MGEKLNDAGSAANPWTENLPGSYIPGQAGYIVGTNLDAAVSGVADDVWNHVDAQLLLELVTLQEAYVNNKKGLVKVGSTWHFRIYDAAGTGIIKDKELKDKDGNDITDIAAGALALELMSSV